MNNSQVYKVNPEIETHPQVVRGKNFAYRYAYARSSDCRAEDEVGQDYLIFGKTEDTFFFALCDGVSQSFFGDVAARVLGEGLLGWLEEVSTMANAASLRGSLSAFLGDLTRKGSAAVAEHPIPDDLAPMLQEVLAEKRSLGSESTFVCGRVDLPSDALPQGRLLLAWMGDSRLRFWGPKGERTSELRDTFRTEERWSTKRGVVNGEPHVHLLPLTDSKGNQKVRRLMMYSDGLTLLDEVEESISNFRLKSLILKAGHSPTSDDVSFLEVWLSKVPEIVEKKPSKKVSNLTIEKQKQQQIILRWQAVPGVSVYEILVRNQGVQYLQTEETKWISGPLPPGKSSFWVRAIWPSGETTLLSDPVGIAVAASPSESLSERKPDSPTASEEDAAKPKKTLSGFLPLLGIVGGGLILVSMAFFGYFFFFGGASKTTLTPTSTPVTATEKPARITTRPPTDSPTPTETTVSTLSSTPTVSLSPTPELSHTPVLSLTPDPSQTPTLPPLPVPTTTLSPKDGMILVYIPEGKFEMGGADGVDTHTVFLDAFWIDEHEVTYEQYKLFIEATDASPLVSGEGKKPVTNVTWHDAKAYCEWSGRRLPTEAEWEKAARGRLEGKRYPWGDKSPVCAPGAENGAQFSDCTGETVPVKIFAPNGYGLYNVAGNVMEWVADWFDPAYDSNSSAENPIGPDTGDDRVLRGGATQSYPYVSLRGSLSPMLKYTHIGFRCARSAEKP